MISTLAERVVEGVTDPRGSLRAFLGRGPHGPDAVMGLVLAAYAVQAICAMILPGGPSRGDADAFSWHMAGFTVQLIAFAVTVGLVYWIGRLFGGRGEVWDVTQAVSWYVFLSSFLTPLAQAGAAGGGLLLLLFLAGIAIALRMLAGFVAEVHGFRSTGMVLGVIVVMIFPFALASLIGKG